MKTNMPVGIDDFKTVRENYYLVDKTDFIRQLIDYHSGVMLFTRPRRFGKTLTMSMLDYFFSIDKKDEAKKLFHGMAIERAGARYMAEQGKYPVIFMTLKGMQNDSWDQLYGSFTFFMQKEFIKHDYLLEGTTLKKAEKRYYERIMDGTAQPFEYQVSLLQLTEFLSRYFGQKPIVLIDEYDAPIQAAYQYGFYEEAMNFFRLWFNNTFKQNLYLSFAVLTGVQRVAKESIFSGLNNLDVYPVVRKQYSHVFGFTASEVAQMAADLHATSHVEEIKRWYDGYTFGQTEIYNPWSVIKYFSEDCVPAPYWISTSDNGILRQLLHQATSLQMQELQDLLQGKSVSATVNDNVVYRTLHIGNDALYTVLLMTGYLTIEAPVDYIDNRYLLRIPNEEIKRVYRFEILNTLAQGINNEIFERLSNSLFGGKVKEFEGQLQQLLVQFVSSYDTGGHESFYHGFMLGMTALFLDKEYIVESNHESGYGRFDVAIFPKDTTKAGVIMEFKVAPTVKELEEKAQEGLRQIEERQYMAEFQKRHIQSVWKYGIAFCQKHVCVTGINGASLR